MTETIDTAQPEALRLASWLRDRQSHLGPSRFSLRDPEVRAEWDDYDKAAIALESLHSALAAAEARNATLTDDGARVERNRDMWKDQCARQAKQLETLQPIARRYLWLRDRAAAPSWYAAHANMGISCEVFDMRLDAEIARAAASISTKDGDTHAEL